MTTTSATTGSITAALGAGSGIDLKALTASLVDAQFQAKSAQLTAKADTLTAQISGVAKLKSALTGFDAALKSLVKSGTLTTQPVSSNANVLGASLLSSGGSASGLPVAVTVEQLATAQAATSAAIDPAASFAGGKLTVTLGGSSNAVTKTITVAAGATLADVAKQIGIGTGLSTALVADGGGMRLTLKGATGESQAFSVTASDTDGATGASLAALATGTDDGMTIGTQAQDAKLLIDGARYSRSSNSINNLVPGVKLELASASTTPITISATPPNSALSQAVSDFVDTYNEMRSLLSEETNSATGVLKADTAATNIGRALAQITTAKLSNSGQFQMLADIGVRTNRDGTLSVDSARLTSALSSDPAGVEALFANGTGATGGGLSAAFSALTSRLTDRTYGLDAATTRYTRQQSDLGKQQQKASQEAEAMSTRLTQQFAAMDARVSAYKSTQTFLENQIKAWNSED